MASSTAEAKARAKAGYDKVWKYWRDGAGMNDMYHHIMRWGDDHREACDNKHLADELLQRGEDGDEINDIVEDFLFKDEYKPLRQEFEDHARDDDEDDEEEEETTSVTASTYVAAPAPVAHSSESTANTTAEAKARAKAGYDKVWEYWRDGAGMNDMYHHIMRWGDDHKEACDHKHLADELLQRGEDGDEINDIVEDFLFKDEYKPLRQEFEDHARDDDEDDDDEEEESDSGRRVKSRLH